MEVDGAVSDVFATDEFRMCHYKVLRCLRRDKHEWTECPYAHCGEKAKRRAPIGDTSYAAVPCPDMLRAGRCPRGDRCAMAHNVFELWLHPARYRTQECRDGAACTRKLCFFAHCPAELRRPVSAAQSELQAQAQAWQPPAQPLPALVIPGGSLPTPSLPGSSSSSSGASLALPPASPDSGSAGSWLSVPGASLASLSASSLASPTTAGWPGGANLGSGAGAAQQLALAGLQPAPAAASGGADAAALPLLLASLQLEQQQRSRAQCLAERLCSLQLAEQLCSLQLTELLTQQQLALLAATPLASTQPWAGAEAPLISVPGAALPPLPGVLSAAAPELW